MRWNSPNPKWTSACSTMAKYSMSYTDDSILAGPDPKEIKRIMDLMCKANLDIAIEGDREDFLGVNINRKDDGTIHLIEWVIVHGVIEYRSYSEPNIGYYKSIT